MRGHRVIIQGIAVLLFASVAAQGADYYKARDLSQAMSTYSAAQAMSSQNPTLATYYMMQANQANNAANQNSNSGANNGSTSGSSSSSSTPTGSPPGGAGWGGAAPQMPTLNASQLPQQIIPSGPSDVNVMSSGGSGSSGASAGGGSIGALMASYNRQIQQTYDDMSNDETSSVDAEIQSLSDESNVEAQQFVIQLRANQQAFASGQHDKQTSLSVSHGQGGTSSSTQSSSSSSNSGSGSATNGNAPSSSTTGDTGGSDSSQAPLTLASSSPSGGGDPFAYALSHSPSGAQTTAAQSLSTTGSSDSTGAGPGGSGQGAPSNVRPLGNLNQGQGNGAMK